MDSKQSPYVDMSAAELRLTLLAGPVDASRFHVLEAQTVNIEGLEVEARIIGASHWVTLRMADLCIHELFSCHQMKDETALLQYGPLGQVSGPVDLLLFGKLNYTFNSRVMSLCVPDAEAREIRESALLAGDREGHMGLIQEFPSQEGLPAPQTIVWACLEPGAFKMATIHSYPNEGSLVITRTRVFTDIAGKVS
ncbi:MAG: DUF2617 family protein [Desulfatibacillum sp.]|nr:DUF2617 family protein [Desulfatibacillum sp.]